jgi:hypothetical protein
MPTWMENRPPNDGGTEKRQRSNMILYQGPQRSQPHSMHAPNLIQAVYESIQAV